jgi:hypothetical protein
MLRVDGLETNGDVLRLTSHGDGRIYRYLLARKGDTLAGYAVAIHQWRDDLYAGDVHADVHSRHAFRHPREPTANF